MHCPTCSSPLPYGAMFCGQCGRAISSSDWAAFARAREQAAVVDSTPRGQGEADERAVPDEAAWSLRQPPAAAVPAGTPWWVTESEGPEAPTASEIDESQHTGGQDAFVASESESDAEPETDAQADAGSDEDAPAADGVSAADAVRADDGASVDEGGSADESVGRGENAADASSPATTERPDEETIASIPSTTPIAPLAVPSPAPLRPPGSTLGSGRPASVPLWTASLTPISDDDAEANAARRAETGTDSAGGGTGAQSPTVPGDDPETSEPAVARVEASPTPEGQPEAGQLDVTSPDPEAAEPDVTPSEPDAALEPEAARPGDTNVIAPLVTPGPERIEGRLHCTNCGAPLSDDDIFCGECGDVVRSVAQSFTGPITPISTGDAPPSAPASEHRSGNAERHEVAASEAATPPAPQPRPAPLAPTPVSSEPSVPPFVAEPEKPRGKKRRLFGRRPAAESPQLWSGTPSGTASGGDSGTGSSRQETSTPVPPMPRSSVEESRETEPAPRVVRADQVPVSDDEARPSSPAEPPLAVSPMAEPAEPAEQRARPLDPLPAAPVVDRPAAPWAVNLGTPVDDVEKTRIVRRQPLGEPFVLQFSTGESFTVQGTGLVGRAPTPQPGEAIDLLVRIVDPGRSVSKTHLEFGQDDGALWVSDRWSGNGSVVRAPSEEARRVEPGKRVRVPRGSRVEIGEQFFMVN